MNVSTNVIHIEDSYKIKKRDMVPLLLEVKEQYPDCLVFKRKMGSLVREWVAHNRLYRFGIFKSHTKDVDLEYPIK